MEHEFNNLRVIEGQLLAALSSGDADAEGKARQAARDTLNRLQARFDALTVITPETILG